VFHTDTQKTSSLNVRDSVKETQTLQRMLGVVMKTVINYNAEVAAAQDQAITLVAERINNEMGAVMNVLGTALSSSSQLQQQIVSGGDCWAMKRY
jgi:uncharacterized protein YqeY